MKMLALMVIIAAIGGTVMAETEELQVPPADALKLPAETSRYNRGALPGRYRDENRRIRSFELKAPAPLYDGGGRQVGIVTKPVRLNIGAGKEMRVQGRARVESFAWAWATEAGSGWIARSALVDPPPVDVDPARNPPPPRSSRCASTPPKGVSCSRACVT
jgi:hypothetical protein